MFEFLGPQKIRLTTRERKWQGTSKKSRLLIISLFSSRYSFTALFQIRADSRVKNPRKLAPWPDTLSCWVRKFGKTHVCWLLKNLPWPPDSWNHPSFPSCIHSHWIRLVLLETVSFWPKEAFFPLFFFSLTFASFRINTIWGYSGCVLCGLTTLTKSLCRRWSRSVAPPISRTKFT